MTNTTKGLVSVVLPVYNRGHIVGEAISSVIGQTYGDFELIVVDDGSTDNTESEIKKFNDPRVIYHRAGHGGVSRARNFALELCKGEYLAFIDSDDVYLPRKLESQVAFLSSRPDVMVAYSPYREICGGKETYHSCDHGDGVLFLEMFKGSFVNVNSILVRKSCTDEVGGFPEGYTTLEDYDFFLRLAERFKFGYVDDVSSVYRMSKRDDGEDTNNYIHYINYIKGCGERFKALKENPKVYNWKYGKVLYGLGKSHFRAGRYDEARECIRESLKYRWQPDVVMFLLKHRGKLKGG